MAVAHSDDIDCCSCKDSFASFEKNRFNEILEDKNKEIQSLRSELKRLVSLLCLDKKVNDGRKDSESKTSLGTRT